MQKPNGGVYFRRLNGTPALNESLLAEVLSRENMRGAWKRVKANKGVSGMYGMSIDAFPEFALHRWKRIRSALIEGTYRPVAVQRVLITEPAGGERSLGMASAARCPEYETTVD